jgi:hypothetical protein
MLDAVKFTRFHTQRLKMVEHVVLASDVLTMQRIQQCKMLVKPECWCILC